jgi:hypothetical protein
VNEDVYVMKVDSIIGITLSNTIISVQENSVKDNDFLVYPTIATEGEPFILINSSKKFSYDIYDIYSREIIESKQIVTIQKPEKVSLGSFPPGIYFLRIESNGKIQTTKIIKR